MKYHNKIFYSFIFYIFVHFFSIPAMESHSSINTIQEEEKTNCSDKDHCLELNKIGCLHHTVDFVHRPEKKKITPESIEKYKLAGQEVRNLPVLARKINAAQAALKFMRDTKEDQLIDLQKDLHQQKTHIKTLLDAEHIKPMHTSWIKKLGENLLCNKKNSNLYCINITRGLLRGTMHINNHNDIVMSIFTIEIEKPLVNDQALNLHEKKVVILKNQEKFVYERIYRKNGTQKITELGMQKIIQELNEQGDVQSLVIENLTEE